MRFLPAAMVLTAVMSAPVCAQTTSRCYWVGSVWTCDQTTPVQQSPGVDWNIPSRGDSFGDSVRRGMELGESASRARNARAERERIEAETEFYRAQTEATRTRTAAPSAVPAPPTPDYVAAWIEAARPRMGLYPDFEKVVFAPEVNITPDMVRLMTSSPLAADIAYYLATHRAESAAISTMPLLEAARAIDKIEAELRASAPAG